ncbi:GGDEF domain-containing protein [Zobellella denitrificans]|nr:GGDEF domain-containing protein [Zobellella denitrificans]
MGSEQQRLAVLSRYHILDTPPEPAFDDITRLAAHLCNAPVAVINFIDEERQWFKSEIGLGVRETPLDISICVHALLEQELLVVPDTRQDPRFASNPLVTGEPYLRFYAGALLRTPEGLPLGTLCVLDYLPRTLTEEQLALLQALARQVMRLLELGRINRQQAEMLSDLDQTREKLAVLAATDPLTGLANRRAFGTLLKQYHSRLQSRPEPATLLMIDIDYFKQLNDDYGHQVGDDALIHFARIARRMFRATDTVGRWGGEEFLVLLPRTDPGRALVVAERLRTTLADTPVNTPEPRPTITISIGLIGLDPELGLAAILKQLDQALYRAKEEGRNRTLVASSPQDPVNGAGVRTPI